MHNPQTGTIQPVVVTFAPTWFNRYYGMDFSESTWADPIDRVERGREMARLQYDRFSDVGLGCADPGPGPVMSDAYGNYFMPALFGCDISYHSDQAPASIALNATIEDMRNLQVPDFDTNPVIQRSLSEAKILIDKYGFCHGGINTGSPINVAVNVFGEEFLMACAAEPETAQHVLMVIAETEFKLYRELSAFVAPSEFPLVDIAFGYGNCPAIMFSPKLYREVILPVDKWVRSQSATFHLHHCGVIDQYVDIYKELTPASIDIGGGSNYKAVREAFPDTPFSMIVNAPDVEGRTVSEVDNLIGNMVEGAAPTTHITTLWVGEAGDIIADETVKALRTAHERINI
ncbi:MAG: uroporphyrinogen decarboxylase/cobalamine-independent methonine synthase family protein [Armatimonadota bacterium]